MSLAMKTLGKIKTGFWSCLCSGAMSSLVLTMVPDMITSASACEEHAESHSKAAPAAKGVKAGANAKAAPQAPHTRVRKDGTLEEISTAAPEE